MFDGVLSVQAKLLTPIAQLGEDGLKTRTFIIEDNDATVFVDVPIFSANGVGGMLRRAATYLLFTEAIKKGYLAKLSDSGNNGKNPLESNDLLKLFFLYTVGGGSVMTFGKEQDGKALSDYGVYMQMKEVADANPFVSLFGLTLRIPSKLIITDLLPVDLVRNESNIQAILEKAKALADRNKEERKHNWIPAYVTDYANKERIVVVDDVIKNSVFAKLFLTDKVKEEWVKFAEEFSISQKGKSDSEKEKKQTIQNIQDMPYIPAGAVLRGEISCKDPLTPVEYGMLLRSLEVLARQGITDMKGYTHRLLFGSFGKRGFGRVRLSIQRNGMNLLAVQESSNVFDVTTDIEVVDTEDLEWEALEAFDEWLENMSFEAFTIPLKYTKVVKR